MHATSRGSTTWTVKTLACGHVARAGDKLVCAHLTGSAEQPLEVHFALTGSGVDYDVLCGDCAGAANPREELVQACEGCVDRADDWGALIRWIGEPEVWHADRRMPAVTETAGAIQPVNEHCIAPLHDGWLVHTGTELAEVNEAGVVRRLPAPELAAPAAEQAWVHSPRPVLHTSPNGRFAAVCIDYGTTGAVVDLVSGEVVLPLEREDYHAYTVPYPFAFVAQDEVVVGTAWNRLEVFALPSGRRRAADPGDAALDYFHGRLTANPSGTLVLDDGWVWHPVGIPMVVDVAALPVPLEAKKHGTEMVWREWWDDPVAWVDDRTLVLSGIGGGESRKLPGVLVFDTKTGRRTAMFAGPDGRIWAAGGLLYVRSEAGLERWDPATGTRTGVVAGFHPATHNPATGLFAEITGGVLRTWRDELPAGD